MNELFSVLIIKIIKNPAQKRKTNTNTSQKHTSPDFVTH